MTEPTQKRRRRVAEAVESGVEGLLLFLVRYFWTGASVIARPRRSLRRLLADRHAARPAYVLPLTYLSVGLFLLSLLGQTAGLLIFDWIWFIDDLAGKVTETLSKEISLVKVAVQALPGVLIVAVFAVILRAMLRTHAPRSGRLVPYVLSYAFGAQACVLFLVVFGFVVLATVVGKWTPPGGELGENVVAAAFYATLLGGLVAAFACPLVFALSALELRRLWRRNRWAGAAVFATVTMAIMLGHLGVLYATKLPTVVIQRAKGATSPELNLSEGTYWLDGDILKLRLSITLQNRSSTPIGWETRKFKLGLHPISPHASTRDCTADALWLAGVGVTDGAGIERKFVSVDPGQTQWFEVVVELQVNELTRATIEKSREWGVGATLTLLNGDATTLDCAFPSLESVRK